MVLMWKLVILAIWLPSAFPFWLPRLAGKINQRVNARVISFDEFSGEDRDHSLALELTSSTSGGKNIVEISENENGSEKFDPASTLLTSRDTLMRVLKLSLLSLSILSLTLRNESALKIQSKIGCLLAESTLGSNLIHLGLASASSACCAVQLILNMLNFGCAGLNMTLGPLRPLFLGITIAVNVDMWMFSGAKLSILIRKTLGVIIISLLPEILFLYQQFNGILHTANPQYDFGIEKQDIYSIYSNNNKRWRWIHYLRVWLTNPFFRRNRIFLQILKKLTSKETQKKYQYELISYVIRTQGMGCTACTHKVHQVLGTIPSSTLVNSHVDLTKGIISLTIRVPLKSKNIADNDVKYSMVSLLNDKKTVNKPPLHPLDDIAIVNYLCNELSVQGYPSNLLQRTKLGPVVDWRQC